MGGTERIGKELLKFSKFNGQKNSNLNDDNFNFLI